MAKLSFEPKFHRQVTLPDGCFWTMSPSWIVCFNAPIIEMLDEQRRIEAEGGSVIVFDAKSDHRLIADLDRTIEHNKHLAT